MRILHISSPKTWRGGEQQLIYLVEELSKLGVWQMVMCPFNSPVHQYCLKHHINHHTYFKGFSANPVVGFRVNHVCKQEKISLIHAHDSHAHNFAILSAALANNPCPVIVARRVDFPVQDGAMSAFKYNHPRIAKIICVSEAIREIMLPDIVDKSKLAVVHSGIDLSRFHHTPSDILHKEFGIAGDTKLIGNVAALAPHKDYPTFVRTAKHLVNAGLKAKFLVIGEGPSRRDVVAAIRQHNMEEHINLTGFRNDIPQILPELDLFLITSKTEGLGTSVLDALACGVPVVATSAGGIPEIITHGVDGLLCPPEDDDALAQAVLKLCRDTALAKSLSAAGLEKVKQFSKAATAQKTLEVYDEVL